MNADTTDRWNAVDRARHSSLQEAMAAEVLALLDRRGELRGDEAFTGFCRAGFGAWTGRLAEVDRPAFVADVIAACRRANRRDARNANVFAFVQADFTYERSAD